jgi:phasin family protein
MAENAARNFAQKASTDIKEATSDIRDTWENSKTTAREATKAMEQSYVTASKGAVDFNLKLIDIAQDNMNAAFEFARQVSHVKSPSEFLEVSTTHARKQFEKLSAQSQELAGLAQKGMTEAAQTLQTGVAKISKRT